MNSYLGPDISASMYTFTQMGFSEYSLNSYDKAKSGATFSDNSLIKNNQTDNFKTDNNILATKISEKKVDLNFMLVGDSLMLTGYGPILEGDLLKFQNTHVIRQGKFSSGLTKPNYFDWNKRTSELLTENKSDYLIVMFGANDGQDIIDQNNNSVRLYSDGWADVYAQRVRTFLEITTPQVEQVFWIGQPIPGNNDFFRKFSIMNPIYKSVCESFPKCHYINLWDRFLVNGKFSQIVTDDNGKKGAVKSEDGVHVTILGGQIMSTETIKQLKSYVGFVPK